MNPSRVRAQYVDLQLNELAGGIEERRWKIAELARDLKAEKFEGWAELVGSHRKVRRSARTVRMWARVAEAMADFCHERETLVFSGWEAVVRYWKKVTQSDLDEAVLVGAELTVDEFEVSLRELFGEANEPDFPGLCRRWYTGIQARFDLAPPGAKPHLRKAIDELREAEKKR